MANVTVTTNLANIPVGTDKDIIRSISFKTVLQKTVNQIPWKKGMGQTIFSSRTVNWAKQIKFPDTNTTPTAYNTTREALYIDTFEYSASLVEDFAALFIPDAVIADIARTQGYALARGVDVAIANQFQSFSQQVTGTGYNIELIFADLLKALQLIQIGGVDPDEESVFAVFSVNQAASFKSQQVFTDSTYAGQDGINNFKKAKLQQTQIIGATALTSLLLRAPSGGGHDMALYSKDAIGLAFAMQPEVVEEWRGFEQGKLMITRHAYGIKRSQRGNETPGSTSVNDAWAVGLKGV